MARDRLPARTPVALAPAESFTRVQSKLAFARLLDELGAPQPRWWLADSDTVLDQVPYPYFLKAAFSTEVLTPVVRDPASLVPLLRVAAAVLARPSRAGRIAGHTVAAYSVTGQTIARLRDGS